MTALSKAFRKICSAEVRPRSGILLADFPDNGSLPLSRELVADRAIGVPVPRGFLLGVRMGEVGRDGGGDGDRGVGSHLRSMVPGQGPGELCGHLSAYHQHAGTGPGGELFLITPGHQATGDLLTIRIAHYPVPGYLARLGDHGHRSSIPRPNASTDCDQAWLPAVWAWPAVRSGEREL